MLIRLFNQLGGVGGAVTGAALASGAAFAKDVFTLRGMGTFAGREYPAVAALMLKGSKQEILEFSRGSGDEAFSAAGPWVLERTAGLPGPLQRWRSRGRSMVPRSVTARPEGPERSVAKNAACPCGSGRKARRCHPSSGIPAG